MVLQGAPIEGDIKITCKVTLTGGRKENNTLDYTDVWYINDVKQKVKIVMGLISNLRIRMDNKCMFLPQELIPEFVNLNPKEVCAYVHACMLALRWFEVLAVARGACVPKTRRYRYR